VNGVSRAMTLKQPCCLDGAQQIYDRTALRATVLSIVVLVLVFVLEAAGKSTTVITTVLAAAGLVASNMVARIHAIAATTAAVEKW
jgi:hypothetical protein